MGLQIRLVHALADRMMEVEPRAGAGALVIGRAAEADIQIPSLNVSRKHALLIPQQTGWALQDCGGGRGTFVNGQPLVGAIMLNSGDVITLGSDPVPATLVIDPYGAAGSPQDAAYESQEPVMPQPVARASQSALPQPSTAPVYSATPAGTRLPPQPIRPPQPGATQAPPPVYEPSSAYDAPAEEADWMTAATSAPASTASRPRKLQKQQMGTGTIMLTIVLIGAIIGGAAYLYVKRSQEPQVASTVGVPPKSAAGGRATPRVAERFHAVDAGGDSGGSAESSTGTRATDPPMNASASSGSRGNITLPPGFDSARSPKSADTGTQPNTSPDEEMAKPAAPADREWAKVEDAHNTSPAIVAVAIYDDYMRIFPSSPHGPEIKKYAEEAMDLIWWKRIADLMKKRDDLKKDSLRKDAELIAETSPDFKKKLAEEKVDIEKELVEVMLQLQYMKYDLQDPPNTGDPAALKVLRQARDNAVYEQWKVPVYAKIKSTRGAKAF